MNTTKEVKCSYCKTKNTMKKNNTRKNTMIILEINRQQYVLNSLEEAESLLRILGNATPVDSFYHSHSIGDVYFTQKQNRCVAAISIISQKKIYPESEAIELQEEAEEIRKKECDWFNKEIAKEEDEEISY